MGFGLEEDLGFAVTKWEPWREFWAWPDSGLTGALRWLSAGKTGAKVRTRETRTEGALLVQASDEGGRGPGGVGGLWPCLLNIGLIASGVYLSVTETDGQPGG